MRKSRIREAENVGNLSREDWIEAAWQMLGRGGLDRVNVDALAKELKVTRGSFYWHFKNRDDLIKAILDYWNTLLGLAQSMEPVHRYGGSCGRPYCRGLR